MDFVDSILEQCRDHAVYDSCCNGSVILAMVSILASKKLKTRVQTVISFPPPSFVVIKIIIGVNLLGYATRRRAGMEEREARDLVNDFGRDPIGEGKEEQV